ncbi:MULTISPECIES: bifunctional phosphopantothenoylcysteine decarboxylase/phosphopantothenate--cysteine ligase CoaBC [Rhodopseudomonas]|uniref:Coenzyme A biosynthesis bifunctional protein CoaBC n=1 Tax=Rhodopseudomonas palustris TaxID=1076 RepID=A0A0D7EPE2_RHOPL|nr:MULTISPECIES: bifunctional phosphopantothenoylcysteine decarboxylase/phosphopantothenate--cysteine ligase CoaBC [Rhodopseudomonas]KIZ42536.1 bifunctional phosphopantothenoylcysteine decarboxylase/phosphopantothenate synthase [Rhodopseudomonas palustris]MDF3810453.1 bifunctional phosphopantothenoylcysteine decarboxylase/phosphopantothenate--cysteine ligase CoaBC [Rhodopseudomonas sp. BAL398]WOK16200.1 bifunctional phosphopantothenoylcysteine decarboxylase/phosphopantothenate--cysteine ligase C
MASLTIRKLDDALKAELRQRAARNGRSMEDEVRVMLREATQPRPDFAAAPPQEIPQSFQDPAGEARDDPRAHRVTLIVGGGIAAYKAMDLIRRLMERGADVRVVLTRAAQHFVTPLTASALSHQRCYTDLFDPNSEFDAGHIRLARDCDLIVVAPATADLMAKIAGGHADDLATAILLATNRPVLLAPAMNPLMWNNAATRRNVDQLTRDGIALIGPNAGEMAEAGEAGTGRMAEPIEIATAAEAFLQPPQPRPLAGKRVLITAGPTHEPIDPVRYIANRSSGKQGFAIAAAAAAAGAEVILIAGPVELSAPAGVTLRRIESAREMLAAVEAALPVDIAIFAAAVADWRVADAGEQKLKKDAGGPPPLLLTENPDILATIAKLPANRPALVIGFAAETEHLIANATAKLARKGCDWIVANDVSPATGIMGGDRNTVHLLIKSGDATKVESWPAMSKTDVATALVARIAQAAGTPDA